MKNIFTTTSLVYNSKYFSKQIKLLNNNSYEKMDKTEINIRVSVQGVESLVGHYAGSYYSSKRKGKYFYTFNHSYSEKSSNRAT